MTQPQRPRCIWCVLGRHTTTGPLQPWHPLTLVAVCHDPKVQR